MVDKVKMIYFTGELKLSGKTGNKYRQTEGTEILQEDVYCSRWGLPRPGTDSVFTGEWTFYHQATGEALANLLKLQILIFSVLFLICHFLVL